MVPIRRYARHWGAYLARGGLGLVASLECLLKNIETRSNENDTHHGKKKFPPGHCYKEYEHPSDEEHRTAEQFNWKRESILSIITTFAVIAAAVYARYAYVEARRQAVASEGQLDQAKRQTVIAESGARPYIFAVITDNRFSYSAIAGQPDDLGVYSSQMQFYNYGSTPAMITNIRVGMAFKLIENPHYLDVETHPTDLIIEAGKSYGRRPYQFYIQQPDEQRLVVGDLSLYFGGQVF